MTTRSEFTVGAGETVSFTLTSMSSLEKIPPAQASDAALKETEVQRFFPSALAQAPGIQRTERPKEVWYAAAPRGPARRERWV